MISSASDYKFVSQDDLESTREEYSQDDFNKDWANIMSLWSLIAKTMLECLDYEVVDGFVQYSIESNFVDALNMKLDQDISSFEEKYGVCVDYSGDYSVWNRCDKNNKIVATGVNLSKPKVSYG